MNDAEKLSAIKRINDRIKQIKIAVDKGQIAKSFYDRFRAAIDRVIPQEFLTKIGNISHGKKAVSWIPDHVLRVLESRQTKSQILESAKHHIMEENPFDYEDPSEIPAAVVADYLDDADYVNTELTDNYREVYDILDLKYRGTKGRKSFAELRQTIEEGKALGHDEVRARLDNRISPEESYFT